MNVSSSFMDEGENNICVERSADINYSKTASKWYLARSLYDGVEDRNLRQLKTLLLSKGANPNTILPEYGIAPIHLAVGIEENQFGFEATKLFIGNGADPNVKSLDGLTPVHIAALWGRTSVLQLLLANGGNPWLLDGDNKNAFCLAHEQDQWETLKLLDSFKNAVFFEQPEQSSEAKYKLRLDRVKVFNKDVCAEYKALPMSLKCCSTQTAPTMTARSADCCTTTSDSDKVLRVIKREKSVTHIKAESKTVSSKNNEYLDDAYNIKFNLYPSNQELQALELVRKHRKGITVFEYAPEMECNGDDSDSGSHENDSRCSRDNSISGSLNSLVRGSVFADVKSKLKLFYKNMSSSNNNCTWRKNLIQKRKEKERLKKESCNSIKSSTCNFNDVGSSEKSNETAHSSNTYIVQPKNSFSNTYKHKEIHSDSKIKDSYNSSAKLMDENKLNVRKSYSCIWRSQSKKDKSKNRSLKRNDESDLNITESFHRFEDVIESFTFDNTDKIIAECNKKDSYMNETINCNDDSVPCNFNADNTEGIGSSSSPTVHHNIGFVIGDENDSKTNNGLYDSSFMVHEYKREIGFTVNDVLLKTCLGLNERGNNTVKKFDVNTSCSQKTNQHQDSRREINIETNDSSGKESCIKDKYVSKIFDESAIFTEDDSYNSHEFICFDSKKSLENKDNIMKINNNNSNNINSTMTSVSEIFFSCTSFDDSKKNPDEKQLVTESVKIPDINTSFIINESGNNNFILNHKISEKHIEDIMIYETDNNDSFANENLIKSKSSSNCDYKKLTNEAVTNTLEKIENMNEHNSMVAEFDSPDTSLVLPSADCHNCSSDCSETTNKFCDQIFPVERSTSPRSPTSNSCVNNSNDVTEYIPSIQISSTPSRNNGCGAKNLNQVSESNGVQETNFHKWTSADVISSDEETDVSIFEEYLYTDEDDGIELIEERHLPIRASHKISKQTTSSNSNEDTDKQVVNKNDAPATGKSAKSESESALSSVDAAYETDALRKELKEFGLIAGPITSGTKRVYLRRLKRARRKPVFFCPPDPKPEFSPELERLLRDDKKDYVEIWSYLESDMSKAFENPDPNKRWREGIAKNSFTYLLLDPRVTQDLPYRYYSLNHKERLMCFLQGIFYVGRGKRSRPYSHLNEALEVYNSWKNTSSKKINRILEIWRDGLGVVCLHIFQNVIPAEAMTREAAMIDALGLQALSNERVGDYYGSATTWSLRQRQQLGAVLLNRALLILIGEGERQIKPRDVSRQ